MGLSSTWPAPCTTLQEVRSHAWSPWHVAMATSQDQDVAPTTLFPSPCAGTQLLGPCIWVVLAVHVVWSCIARPYRASDRKSFSETWWGKSFPLALLSLTNEVSVSM